MSCIYLNNDTLKILGTHFSCNEKLKEKKNCKNVQRYSTSTENIKKLKPYTRGGNRYSYNNTDINNCPKTYCERI